MPGIHKDPKSDIESKANDLVYYFITQNAKQTIIKRADIVKYVIKDLSRSYDIIYKDAVNKLNNVFGYDVIFIEGKKGYIVVNKLPIQNSITPLPMEKKRKLGLVFLILSHIHNSGGVVAEDNLWQFLELFGIKSDVMHNVFGEVRKFIFKTLAQECYLEVSTVTSRDPPLTELKMGPRATHEIDYATFTRFNHDLVQMH